MSGFLFVGHYNPKSRHLDAGSSIAGAQVQKEILEELRRGASEVAVEAISLMSTVSWPRGPILIRGLTEENTRFPGYINLPVVKNIMFSVIIFIATFRLRAHVIQYNSYFFENLAVRFATFVSRRKCAIFVQDVMITQPGAGAMRSRIRSVLERIGLKVARRFDLAIPITNTVREDFGFSSSRSIIFHGAPTKASMSELDEVSEELLPYAVFAGALEPYNGVKDLIDAWILQDVPWILHIFGRGTLTTYVKDAEKSSHGRVLYHGFSEPNNVVSFQRRARWNICLRYSRGINQEYFFPSKFFNNLCFSGVPLVNEFSNIPEVLRGHICIVKSNMSNLMEVLLESDSLTHKNSQEARRRLLDDVFSWRVIVGRIILRFGPYT